MADYVVHPLSDDTWEVFAALVERHNGVWGGCWCLAFHAKNPDMGQSVEGNRAMKQRLVSKGQAHAAVVFDGDRAVGWCQFGSPAELPRITHRKEYESGIDEPADYRITCFFVDRDYRREGVAAAALRGAIELIAESGGGVVDGFPYDTHDEKSNASFLYNGTRGLFEQAGEHVQADVRVLQPNSRGGIGFEGRRGGSHRRAHQGLKGGVLIHAAGSPAVAEHPVGQRGCGRGGGRDEGDGLRPDAHNREPQPLQISSPSGAGRRFRVVLFPVITGSTGYERIYDGYPDVALDMVSSRTFDGRIQLLEYVPRVLTSVA